MPVIKQLRDITKQANQGEIGKKIAGYESKLKKNIEDINDKLIEVRDELLKKEFEVLAVNLQIEKWQELADLHFTMDIGPASLTQGIEAVNAEKVNLNPDSKNLTSYDKFLSEIIEDPAFLQTDEKQRKEVLEEFEDRLNLKINDFKLDILLAAQNKGMEGFREKTDEAYVKADDLKEKDLRNIDDMILQLKENIQELEEKVIKEKEKQTVFLEKVKSKKITTDNFNENDADEMKLNIALLESDIDTNDKDFKKMKKFVLDKKDDILLAINHCVAKAALSPYQDNIHESEREKLKQAREKYELYMLLMIKAGDQTKASPNEIDTVWEKKLQELIVAKKFLELPKSNTHTLHYSTESKVLTENEFTDKLTNSGQSQNQDLLSNYSSLSTDVSKDKNNVIEKTKYRLNTYSLPLNSGKALLNLESLQKYDEASQTKTTYLLRSEDQNKQLRKGTGDHASYSRKFLILPSRDVAPDDKIFALARARVEEHLADLTLKTIRINKGIGPNALTEREVKAMQLYCAYMGYGCHPPYPKELNDKKRSHVRDMLKKADMSMVIRDPTNKPHHEIELSKENMKAGVTAKPEKIEKINKKIDKNIKKNEGDDSNNQRPRSTR